MFVNTTVKTTVEVEAVTITLTKEEAFKIERAAAESSDHRFMDLFVALREERRRQERELGV